ncbi:hypothetical protein EUX98_g611 [Antrodiella citrinella]|uniref:JmjC domain-containing protein n=1 Tax=Antrodiella citrinella TaxID=2447956 RepID=A0A4S4N5F9_9APHY|nr:hypothetical protein EUX98_g611 [Antrodiella citrinella]
MDTNEKLSVLKWISQEYYELNGTRYETMDRLPSSLEFSKIVRVASPIPDATKSWSDDFLISRSGTRPISIAVTPNGRADAVTGGLDGLEYFAEPHTEQITMENFLSKISSGARDAHPEICYLQSQNGNVFSSDGSQESEFEAFKSQIPEDLPWCSEALDSTPDAVNLWIGDQRSVTSIHSDPYENIYTVVRGSKTFTLLPPTEGWCLAERTYPHAQYKRTEPYSRLTLVPSQGTAPIRWSSVADPNLPGALNAEAHPMEITVGPGESLYLPAGWWHYVRQSGVTIAVNYWYDLESRGSSWVWLNLLRGSAEPPSSTGALTAEDSS